MSSYDYVFFDLDGTISDSAPGIINSVEYALRAMGEAVPDREALKQFVGPPLIESFESFCGFDEAKSEKAIALFREYFQDHGIHENSMYPGMEALFKTLKDAGKKLVVATSKPEPFARQIIERYGVAGYFDYIAGSTLSEERVKKAEVIRYALDALGIKDVSSVVMVGDRRHDAEGAAALGIDCIGVLYGYGSREELLSAGVKQLADTPQGVWQIVLR